MPANTSPIFTLTPNVGVAAVTAALTDSQGTGTVATNIFKAFTAGANGSFVWRVRWNPTASVAATTTTATVARVFYSTVGSGATTGGTNTWLIGEITLAAVAADHSTAPTSPLEIIINMAIPTGTFIHVSNHAAPAASTNWQAMCIGGDY
jgi:hypothetical protein